MGFQPKMLDPDPYQMNTVRIWNPPNSSKLTAELLEYHVKAF